MPLPSRHVPPAFPGARVGVMGGTFNPPHQGHLSAAETALKRLGLNWLWWLVSPGNPLKSRSGLAPLEERIASCKRLATDPHIIVRAFEAALGSVYTADTLGYLIQRRPGVRFVWIMGADSLANLHRWHRWRSIVQSVPIAVIDRPGWRLPALSSPAARAFAHARLAEQKARVLTHRAAPAWVYLTHPLSELSSTHLRHEGNPRGEPKLP